MSRQHGHQNPASLYVRSEGETSDSCQSAPPSPPPLAPTTAAAAAAVRTSSRRRKTLSDQVSEILSSSSPSVAGRSSPAGGITRSGKSYKKEKRVRFDDKFSEEIAYKKGKSIFIF